MPAATPLEQRQEIVYRREKGQSFAHISREMSISYYTVRNVWRHYQQSGQLAPAYDRCANRGIRKEQAIYEQALEFKREHPSWGAGLIWVELADLFPEEDLPAERTLQRWFHRGGVAADRVKVQSARVDVERGAEVHQVWAMDAKEQMRLADGTKASWLVISDEASGAVLHTELFPCGQVDAD